MTSWAFAVVDIDSGEDGKKKKKKEANVVTSDEIVREIERGWYLKANAGLATYLLRYGPQPGGAGSLIRAGSVVAIAAGNDFVDEPNRSMAWEVQFYQGVHNGMPYEQQPLRDLRVRRRRSCQRAAGVSADLPAARLGGTRPGGNLVVGGRRDAAGDGRAGGPRGRHRRRWHNQPA